MRERDDGRAGRRGDLHRGSGGHRAAARRARAVSSRSRPSSPPAMAGDVVDLAAGMGRRARRDRAADARRLAPGARRRRAEGSGLRPGAPWRSRCCSPSPRLHPPGRRRPHGAVLRPRRHARDLAFPPSPVLVSGEAGRSRLLLAALALAAGSLALLDPPTPRLAVRTRQLAVMRAVRSGPGGIGTAGARRGRLAETGSSTGSPRASATAPSTSSPVQQGVLFLNGLDLAAAARAPELRRLHPRLAELNRAFLAGPRAPDWLLVRWHRIDGRLPALEDGPALLELLARYRPVDEEKGYLLMHREPGTGASGARSGPLAGELQAGRDAGARRTRRRAASALAPSAADPLRTPDRRPARRPRARRRAAHRRRPGLGRAASSRRWPRAPSSSTPPPTATATSTACCGGGTLPHPVSLRLLPTPRVRAFYQPEVGATSTTSAGALASSLVRMPPASR